MTHTKSGLKSLLVEAEGGGLEEWVFFHVLNFVTIFSQTKNATLFDIFFFFRFIIFPRGVKIKFALFRNALFENRLYGF